MDDADYRQMAISVVNLGVRQSSATDAPAKSGAPVVCAIQSGLEAVCSLEEDFGRNLTEQRAIISLAPIVTAIGSIAGLEALVDSLEEPDIVQFTRAWPGD